MYCAITGCTNSWEATDPWSEFPSKICHRKKQWNENATVKGKKLGVSQEKGWNENAAGNGKKLGVSREKGWNENAAGNRKKLGVSWEKGWNENAAGNGKKLGVRQECFKQTEVLSGVQLQHILQLLEWLSSPYSKQHNCRTKWISLCKNILLCVNVCAYLDNPVLMIQTEVLSVQTVRQAVASHVVTWLPSLPLSGHLCHPCSLPKIHLEPLVLAVVFLITIRLGVESVGPIKSHHPLTASSRFSTRNIVGPLYQRNAAVSEVHVANINFMVVPADMPGIQSYPSVHFNIILFYFPSFSICNCNNLQHSVFVFCLELCSSRNYPNPNHGNSISWRYSKGNSLTSAPHALCISLSLCGGMDNFWNYTIKILFSWPQNSKCRLFGYGLSKALYGDTGRRSCVQCFIPLHCTLTCSLLIHWRNLCLHALGRTVMPDL